MAQCAPEQYSSGGTEMFQSASKETRLTISVHSSFGCKNCLGGGIVNLGGGWLDCTLGRIRLSVINYS